MKDISQFKEQESCYCESLWHIQTPDFLIKYKVLVSSVTTETVKHQCNTCKRQK